MATGTTYERLRQLVVSNNIGGSEYLTEVTLAQRLGVSRTPIREALKRLEQEGLVERSGRSVRVKDRSPEEILEIYEVRIMLESGAARAAAQHRTDFDLSQLRAIHEEFSSLPPNDVPRRVVWNTRFHTMLWKASHNSTLEDVMARLIVHVARYPESTLGVPDRWEQVVSEHAAILGGIEESDPERAGAAAAEHMTRARDTRLQMYAREVSGQG
ncbi:MAG: GntR family transcriptional regulator [Acidimicrobiales bacterium]